MPARKALPPLRVVANPFVALDHEGRPAVAVAFDSGDPKTVGLSRRHIAAKHSAELIEARPPIEITRGPDGSASISGDGRKDLHDIWFEFSADVQTIPDTRTHRYAMDPSKGGQPALLPADEATAKAVGVAFVDPSAIVVETARQSLARHLANGGELPEWAHVVPSVLPETHTASLKREALHVSHGGHADFLLAHVAKLAPPTPPKPSAPTRPALVPTIPPKADPAREAV